MSYSKWVHATYPDVPGGDLKAIKSTRDQLKVALLGLRTFNLRDTLSLAWLS
jgi:hypothetical protein